jgi:plasmid stabilization system protein ParE
MMDLKWTNQAYSDLKRLHELLAATDAEAAARAVRDFIAAAARLLSHPRLGERLSRYEPREVRKLVIGNYELRYEIRADTIYLLRLWHARENRR